MADHFINFDKPEQIAAFYRVLAALRGKGEHRIGICRQRKRRSDQQNRYYRGVFCPMLGDYMRDQGEMVDDEAAHEVLAGMFLKRKFTDKQTGEVIEYRISTTKLSTVEFNEFLERCAQWLSELGMVVPEPSVWRVEIDETPPRKLVGV